MPQNHFHLNGRVYVATASTSRKCQGCGLRRPVFAYWRKLAVCRSCSRLLTKKVVEKSNG